MLEAPPAFDLPFDAEDYERLGRLAVKWSHVEHVIGNCLRKMLNMSVEDADIMVFPLQTEQRLQKIAKLAKLRPLAADAQLALDELIAVMKGLQVVRNDTIHGIIDDDGGPPNRGLVNRAKDRRTRLEDVFSCEELTNYAAHAVLSLRYALGVFGSEGERLPLPDRPEIPEFLQELIPSRK